MTKWYSDPESMGSRTCAALVALLTTFFAAVAVVYAIRYGRGYTLAWSVLLGLTALYWWTQAFIPAWYKARSGMMVSAGIWMAWTALLILFYSSPLLRRETYDGHSWILPAAMTAISITMFVGYLQQVRRR